MQILQAKVGKDYHGDTRKRRKESSLVILP